MVPDLTLEVIYFGASTDFKMEFALCGSCNVRFLSFLAKSRTEFLMALQKSTMRSRVIIAVGSFNPLDRDYLPKIIAKATGYVLKPVDKTLFSVADLGEFSLPDTAVPLVTASGEFGGCVLENFDQSIILLTAERDLRHTLVDELVCPYLTFFAQKKGKTTAPDQRVILAPTVPADVVEQVAAPAVESTMQQDSVESAIVPSAIAGSDAASAEPTTKGTSAQVDEFTTEQASKVAVLNEKPAEDIPLDVYSEQEVKTAPEEEAEHPMYTVADQPEHSGGQFNLEDFLTEGAAVPPSEGKGVRRRWWRVFISILLVIAVLLASYFGYEWVFQPMQTANVYAETQKSYGIPWEKLPEEMLYKFGKLYQTNADIYGWLSIPNTNIHLPVVSAAKRSPLYYETHLFDGSANRFGTLYTDNVSSKDGFSRNIVVYGKDIQENTMFSELKKYLELDHYKSAPTFTFDTLYLENNWKIFAVFQGTKQKMERLICTRFFDDAAFATYLRELTEASRIDTNIDLDINDQLITLVSEGEGVQTVVVARCVREGESPLVDVTGTALNESSPSFFESSSAVPSSPSLQEILEEDKVVSTDKNMIDGASSRYEQQEMVSSAITVKPVLSSKPVSSSGSKKPVSNKPASSKPISSVKPSSITTTSQVSSTLTESIKLPTLTVKNQLTGKVVAAPANEILAQVIEAEMGSSYHIEALKAQAVAAYSWLLCNGAADGKVPSAPMKKALSRARQAANAVAGQVAVYGGKVASTYYYAISAGKTANSKDIWSSQLPYLYSVDSSVDKSVNGFQTIRKYAASDVAKWVEDQWGIDLKKTADKSKWFVCSYDKNNCYVTTVKVGGVSKKGPALRNELFTTSRVGAANVLRSSAYKIAYSKTDDKFTFTVHGYGHGVGMSQTGANAYAKSGKDYEWILKHYYTGITLGSYYDE